MEVVLDLTVEVEGFEQYINEEKIEKYIKDVLEGEFDSEKPVYLSVYLTGNEDIQRINRDYRGKDQPTDVISFAYHETDEFDVGPYDTLGDIIVSLERVKEQAADYGHSFEREFYYVLTHGILHLLGYDHIEEEEKKEMREKEEEILNRFGYTRES